MRIILVVLLLLAAGFVVAGAVRSARWPSVVLGPFLGLLAAAGIDVVTAWLLLGRYGRESTIWSTALVFWLAQICVSYVLARRRVRSRL